MFESERRRRKSENDIKSEKDKFSGIESIMDVRG